LILFTHSITKSKKKYTTNKWLNIKRKFHLSHFHYILTTKKTKDHVSFQKHIYGIVSMPENILIIDDEEPIRKMVSFILETASFTVSEANGRSEAFTAIETHMPHLILLDWMLPDCSGLELAQQLKSHHPNLPVIMLTARAEEDAKVKGLEKADDYVVKPFSPKELIARIKAVLRRSTNRNRAEHNSILHFGHLTLDNELYQLSINHQLIKLGPKEYQLIKFLIENPNKVHSREHLLNQVWGTEVYVGERTVDVHIRRLRKALANTPAETYITTLHGIGYSLRLTEKEVV